MKKVAVITRTKDRPEFLGRAIKSVASQTFTDYVHVIVNDGGDKTHVDSLVASLDEASRSRVQVFHRDKASGAPDSIFSESIDRVDSEYVAVHDDDDTWHPEFLERTVAVLENGAKGVAVRTDKVIESVASDGSVTQVKAQRYLEHVKAISLYRQCAENQLTPISFIYARSAYKEVGKYDDSLPVVGDWEFGLRFLLKHDVEYLDPGFSLANYHHRKGGDKGKSTFNDHDHRRYFNLVANRYLRGELAKGELGPGYIISKIRYEQNYISQLLGKVLPSGIVTRLKRRAGD